MKARWGLLLLLLLAWPRLGRGDDARSPNVAFGGQHRLRYELLDQDGAERRSVMLSRNLLHADARMTPELRAFGQVGGFYALGLSAAEAEPPDADALDVTQLFVEARAAIAGLRIQTRVGRQEMALGSTRWVSSRDGTNVRQSFDLVRTTISNEKRFIVDAFFGVVPRLAKGVFDDAPALDDRFWGTYATIHVLPAKLLSFDAFYLGRTRPDVTYGEVHGREVRHTFGTRIFGETSFGLEYVEHGLLQTGEIDGAPVRAWGLASALWQRLPGSLRIGVRGDALSGDSRRNDRRVGTFHPLFPNQTFFSALPAIYPSNLYDVHPILRWETKRTSLEAGCAFFWRQSLEDAVYRPPGQPVDVRADGRGVGAQSAIAVMHRVDEHLVFNAEYAHLFAAHDLAEAGHGAIDFVGTWATYSY